MKFTPSRNERSIACRCLHSTTSKSKLQQYPLVTLLLWSLTSLPTSNDVGCYRCCCFSAGSCTRDSSPVFYILVELSKFGTALILYQYNHSALLLLNADLSIGQLLQTWSMFVKIPLVLWISMSTLRLHESPCFTLSNGKSISSPPFETANPEIDQVSRLPLNLPFWPYLLAIFWICLLREHITRLIISWLPFELVLEWFVLALAMHIYTNI